MGHKQYSLFKTNWQHRFSHGGSLRNQSLGRGQRPISCKEPLHVVFKVNKHRLKSGSLRSLRTCPVVLASLRHWAKYFFVKIEQLTVQHDHIHVLVRAPRRSGFHHFFRVVSGQIAQVLEKEGLLKALTDTPHKTTKAGTGLWKYRPFSRVIRGYKAYVTVKNYIRLNEKEVTGQIPYRKQRLKGLSSQDWGILWEE